MPNEQTLSGPIETVGAETASVVARRKRNFERLFPSRPHLVAPCRWVFAGTYSSWPVDRPPLTTTLGLMQSPTTTLTYSDQHQKRSSGCPNGPRCGVSSTRVNTAGAPHEVRRTRGSRRADAYARSGRTRRQAPRESRVVGNRSRTYKCSTRSTTTVSTSASFHPPVGVDSAQ